MNEVIELAKKCGLSKHEYRVGALVGYEITIQAFYEAAIEIGKAQGAKEFMEALGEPVAELIFDPMFLPTRKASLVDWKIDLMKFDVGTEFYALPNTKDEVK